MDVIGEMTLIPPGGTYVALYLSFGSLMSGCLTSVFEENVAF